MSLAVVTLKKGEGRLLKSGGMWVFDNEIASIMGRFVNGDVVLIRDFDGYPLGKPQQLAGALAKMSAVATFVNAVVSVILVCIIYNALRPALIKANLLEIHPQKTAEAK